jgi:hemerythrin-like domain-containing protein
MPPPCAGDPIALLQLELVQFEVKRIDLNQFKLVRSCDASASVTATRRSDMKDDLHQSPLKRAIGEHLLRDSEQGVTIDEEHQMVRQLCTELESIADALPGVPGQMQLVSIMAALRAGVPAHCRHEEVVLRAWQANHEANAVSSGIAIERIASEHSDNEQLGLELADTLETVVDSQHVENPEALGLLIRLYFTTLRRHLMWEDYLLHHVMPAGSS